MSAAQRIYLGQAVNLEAKRWWMQSESAEYPGVERNLPYSSTVDEVLKFLHLSSHHATVELATARDNPSRKLGFGFVNVPVENVEAVLKYNGATLGERSIKVALARPSDQSKPSRWQKDPSKGSSVSVMRSKPQKGIPQEVLDKLQKLRVRLESKQSEATSKDREASPSAKPTSPPLLVDVGANLTNFRFKGHLEEVLERSLTAGVHKLVVTGTSVENSQMALLLARSLPGVLHCTAGVHPHHAKDWHPSCGELLEGLLANREVVAVGETGLDYNRMFSPMAQQLKAFSAQVEIACKVGKPLFLHEREAHRDLVNVLEKFKDRLPLVIVHCFTGTEAEAEKYIEMGCYIGVTGFVCKADRGRGVRQLLKERTIPLSRLVIETDAPFMMPPLPSRDYGGLDPHGRNNEPCTLPLVVKSLAELYSVSIEEVADATTANAMALFQL